MVSVFVLGVFVLGVFVFGVFVLGLFTIIAFVRDPFVLRLSVSFKITNFSNESDVIIVTILKTI